MMNAKPETTIKELMEKFPSGFAVGPGTPEKPGTISRIIYATSHLIGIVGNYNQLTGNQGYIVVDMDI